MISRMDEQGKCNQDDLLGFDLLAQKLGSTADHEPGHEHGKYAVDRGVQEAHAFAAEYALQYHPGEHCDAGQRRIAVMRLIHGTRRERGSDVGEEAAAGYAEADFLAFHVAAELADGRVVCQHRHPLLLRHDAEKQKTAAAGPPSRRRAP